LDSVKLGNVATCVRTAQISSTREHVVGIIANPASGRDIRRLVARGGVFTLAEKCGIVTRLIYALGVTGVTTVLMIPDRGGIAERVRRAVAGGISDDRAPELVFLDMQVEDGPADTVRGAAQMAAAGAKAILVLGGDGTQRLVAGACGEVPMVPLSTGTNNVFPESREATIAGLATGLVATDKIPAAEVTVRNKILRLEIDGVPKDLAVVDISVSKTVGWDRRHYGGQKIWTRFLSPLPNPTRLGCHLWLASSGLSPGARLMACASIWRHRNGRNSLCCAQLRPG
jgi:hypothetical protein